MYTDKRLPPPQISVALPEQGMLQPVWFAWAEEARVEPHQHSREYWRPARGRLRARQKDWQVEIVMVLEVVDVEPRRRGSVSA